MVLSNAQFINRTSSEKVGVVWIEPKERLITGWSNVSGNIYKQTVSYFVVNIFNDSSELTGAANSSVSLNEWFFDSSTKEIFVNTGGDPDSSFVVAQYRLFYATGPFNLPYDMANGKEVEYEGRITGISKFGHQIDNDDLTGIAVSGRGRIKLINKDNGFEDIFSKLSWEGNKVTVWSWSPKILPTSAQKIYEGLIDSKTYGLDLVSFKLKNVLDRLRNEVPCPLFTSSDGDLSDDIIGTPKRRIYGRVKGLRVQSLGQTLEGFTLTGTFDGVKDATTINVSGGDLFNELSPDDSVFFSTNLETFEYRVETISSSSFTVSSEIEAGFSGQTLKNKPDVPYRKRNRSNLIAHHLLKAPTTTISIDSLQFNRIFLTSITDLEPNDFIYVNGERAQIRRISGSEVILQNNLNFSPVVGQTVEKLPVQDVFFKDKELIFSRDWTIVNTGSESKLTLDDEAEVNITIPENFGSMTWTNASTTVTGTGFENNIASRDWIKPNLTSIYYEVLQVDSDTVLTLRAAFADPTITANTKIKRVDYIDDDSIININCFGKTEDDTSSGVFIKTGAQVVKDLLVEQGLLTSLSTTSFSEAAVDNSFLVSLPIPYSPNGNRPTIRDTITKINTSIFGSLFQNNNQEITYNVLSPKKPTVSKIISDSDILSYSIESTGKNVARTIIVNYRIQDYIRFSDDSGFLKQSFINDFVSNISEITREKNIEIYLFEDNDAKTIGQRVSLLREQDNKVLKVTAKLFFHDLSINDQVYLELDRLPNRFGTNTDKNLIGVITKIAKNEGSVDLEVTDLSGMFSKVGTITESTANIYTSATKIERANNGFITDTSGIINSQRNTNRINLIG